MPGLIDMSWYKLYESNNHFSVTLIICYLLIIEIDEMAVGMFLAIPYINAQ